MNRTAIARVVVVAVGAALASAIFVAAASEPARLDVIAQYAAGRLVLDGRGRDVVDAAAVLAAERTAAPARVALLPFVQVPAAALLFAPLAVLPFDVAAALAALLDAALVACSLFLLRSPAGAWPRLVLLCAIPSAVAIAQGQLSPLVLLLVALASRAGPRTAGVALGLALLRPQTAPLLLLAAVVDPARRWAAVAAAAAVAAISAALVGLDGLVAYARALLDASRWTLTGELGVQGSIGWAGAALLVGVPWLGIAAAAASLLVGAAAVVRAPRDTRVATAALWALLASPHVLVHDAVLAYPAVLLLAARRPWDVASSAAWIAHVAVAPLGVAWSLVLAVAGWRETAARAAASERLPSSVA